MDSAPIANVTLDDPFYYLHHFHEVLSWVASVAYPRAVCTP